jgi:hypothetical protein
MVLSYLASYVYAPSSSAASSSQARSNSGGPIPTRANSVRRTANAGRYGNNHRSASKNGSRSRFESSIIPEDCETEAESFGTANDDPALATIQHINTARSFYDVVGVPQTFKTNEDLRRAYMARCRSCHPE